MKTQVIVFPFDLFGSGGSAEGSLLLADGIREILRDTRKETAQTRAEAFVDNVRIREASFDTLAALSAWRRRGRLWARKVLREGDFLLWLGGNHLSALPVYDELAGKEGTLVVQLDAHLDIHHFHDTTSELSHGNFLLHARKPLPDLVNVGHRDLLITNETIATTFRHTVSAIDLAVNPTAALEKLGALASSASQVFIDIDCDVFDPAFFPAVTQPTPFGLSPPLVLAVLDAVWSSNVRGLILSEFEPGRDTSDRSLSILLWLIEHLLLRCHEH